MGNELPGTASFWSTPYMSRRTGESGALKTGKYRLTLTRRSDRFLAGLVDASSVTFVSHVYPDPDSLGSMVGLAHLVETCLGKPSRLTRDGLIGRAENRVMVEMLDLELTPVEDVDWQPDDAVVMVDSQPSTGRHSFSEDISLYA